MSDAANPFDQGGAPALSFAERDEHGNLRSKPIGTKYVGVIVEAPKVVQSRDYDTGKPATWPDGNPKWSVVIGIEVNGERMSLWAPKPSATFGAIQEALKAPDGKVRNAEIGGTISIELTGFGKAENGKAPQKLYKASYSAPNHFGGEPTTSAAQGFPPAQTSTASSDGDDAAAAAKAAKIASMSDEDRKMLGL